MGDATIVTAGAVLLLALVAAGVVHRPASPTGRPAPRADAARALELILRDARRLGGSFRQPGRGRSFAKYDGTRRAYDAVLVECCSALGVAHRLDELPDSLDRDFERTRIERVLQREGLGIGVSEAA